MEILQLRQPDDLHVHLRDGAMLQETVAATARCFARATVMPNLLPPLTDAEMLSAYRQRIQDARPEGSRFEPLMTLYLTNKTTPETVSAAKAAGCIAAKLYPAGATTNSSAGVNSLADLYPVFERLADEGMLLLIHGEVTDPEIDIFDRERVFIERCLEDIVSRFSKLKIVLEHITTADAAAFVSQGPDHLAATITPQHLLLNRNDLLAGGIRPHNYCLPILKRNTHQEALRAAAASASPKFFLGTDSAPHVRHDKESACGCAGCYSACAAIELYAEAFEQMGCLDRLEAFASEYGAAFYGLPLNESCISLERCDWQVPDELRISPEKTVVPLLAGQTLRWKLKQNA